MATKLEGGGKALVARPLVDELFFAASLRSNAFLPGLYDRTGPYRALLVYEKCPSPDGVVCLLLTQTYKVPMIREYVPLMNFYFVNGKNKRGGGWMGI